MDIIEKGSLKGILEGLPLHVGQVILVLGEGVDIRFASVYLLEKGRKGWHMLLKEMKASIGASGFAYPGEKREGDKKTPSGIFPVEFAFGYEREAHTKMEYRQITEEDVWVDDVESKDYNRWVKRYESDARSFECMKRQDGQYRYGLVIGYNRNPAIPGLGSAIFMHIWKGPYIPTGGCIALSEEDMLVLLSLLDYEKRPAVMIGTVEMLNRFYDERGYHGLRP